MGSANCCNGLTRLSTLEYEQQKLFDSQYSSCIQTNKEGRPPTRQCVLEPIKNIIGIELDFPLDVQDTDMQNPPQILQMTKQQFFESNPQITAKFVSLNCNYKQFDCEEQQNIPQASISPKQLQDIHDSIFQDQGTLQPHDLNQSVTPAFPRGSFLQEHQNQVIVQPRKNNIFVDDLKECCSYQSQNTIKSILKKTVKSKKSQMNQSTKKVRFEQQQPVLKSAKTKNFCDN